ncbi:MAG: tyrosine-type recombinase/integrase, partial [Gammaproteobacteria bacterium]|nr:tyrosine-type recombinase/integrase [Gammaproteobacteria bacterium]
MKTKTDPITDFIQYLKDRQLAHSTLKVSRRVILFFLKWVDKQQIEPEQISYQDLLAFMRHCSQKGTSQKTIQSYLITIKHFYNHLEETRLSDGQVEHVAANPTLGIDVKGIKRKVLYHILESHQLHQLYNQYPNECYPDQRNKIMLGLLVYQGLKVNELSRLEIDHIDLRQGKINVPSGKRSNGREMAIEGHQIMDMYDYILRVRPLILVMKPKRKAQSQVATNRLIIGQGGYSGSISHYISRMIEKLRTINPNVINAKQIRASVITKWVKTHNLRKAQYLAGHRFIGSTESYQENDMEGLIEKINQYHP